MTTQSGTTNVEEDPWYMKILFSGKNPSFETKDGKICVFSNNGEKHSGNIIEKDGNLYIDFDDSSKGFYIDISGDTLTLTSESGNVEIEFRAR